jgi:type IV secretion system protein VirB1
MAKEFVFPRARPFARGRRFARRPHGAAAADLARISWECALLLDLTNLLALAPACAPAVAPSTLLAVAKVESGFDPFAIGVNGPAPQHLTFADASKAAQTARTLIAEGRNIDLGLSQVNVRNLGWLGLSVEAAFDPCRNLAASAQVLEAGYAKARATEGSEQAAVRVALSYYNTGTDSRGFRNGYVSRVVRAAAQLGRATDGPVRPIPTASPSAWDAFGDLSAAGFVLSLPTKLGD